MSKEIKQFDFPIITLRREDLELIGFDGSKLNDETMRVLAEKLGEGYWEPMTEELEHLASDFNVPKLSQS